MSSIREDWEKLNLSHEEVKNLTDALQNEEFRKLLIDYVEETQNPESRKKYQADIIQLEAERGIDCKFINPTPGFVVKTSIDGVGKAFINIATNALISRISSDDTVGCTDSRRPISIPYSLSPGRDDYDKKNQRCIVYDAIFHPDTLQLARTNPRVKNIVIETALNGIESEFGVMLDKVNVKLPKLKYKGAFNASVIRKPSSKQPELTKEELDLQEKLKYPRVQEIKPPKVVQIPNSVCAYTTPQYKIKYRSDVDMQEYTFDRNAKMHAAIPKELVIEIHLPLLNSSKNVILDVSGKSLALLCDKVAKYKLNLNLPYAVSDTGSAKFDVDRKRLIVTLPVVRCNKASAEIVREDSGVESDAGEVFTQELSKEESIPSCEGKQAEDISFLSKDKHYSFPSFDYNRENNTLCFILNVKNVDPRSIATKSIGENGFHIKFSSIGAGFFPVYYAFCAKFAANVVDKVVEAWDNNITVQVQLSSLRDDDSIWVGISEEDMQEKKVDVMLDLSNDVEKLKVEKENEEANVVTVESIDADKVVFSVEMKETSPTLNPEHADDEDDMPLPKMRTYSEGSSDEMSGGARRGILKTRFSRSLSESCADGDNFNDGVLYTWSDSCLPERDESKDVKKTVRFSQKIQQQIFRANSSILGQRRKNQKKNENRRKALERRVSESENSEDEREKWMKYKNRKDVSDKERTPPISGVITEETSEGTDIVAGNRKKRSRKTKSIRSNMAQL